MIQRHLYTILLVDDDPNCLDAINQILRRDGYKTLKIEDGKGALKLLSENSVDLAIVDFNLPDMDGIQVLYEIKRVYRNIPIIIMTSEATREVRAESLVAGAYSFVPKPINIPSFRNIVAKAVQSSRLETVEVRREMIFFKWIRGIIRK